MQIGSQFSMLNGAQIAPRQAAVPVAQTPVRPASQAAGTGDINSLLAYAKAASLQAARARGQRPGAPNDEGGTADRPGE